MSEDRPRIVLTVGVEDYFHAGVFDDLIPHGNWRRFERRVAQSTGRTLALLEECGAHATFFVMGWVAEHMPEVPREIRDRGHEVATQGYEHRTIAQMAPEQFREDLIASREAVERATGLRVLGHRVPHFLGPDDLWALDILAEEGWSYDSSVRVAFGRFRDEPWRRRAHVHQARDGCGAQLVELPVSSTDWLGVPLPLAGGNWFRQFPRPMVRRAIRRWHAEGPDPFVMYFQTWEVDQEQPRIEAVSRLRRLRHYRNLETMPALLRDTLSRHECVSAATHLGLEPGPAAELGESDAGPGATAPEIAASWARLPVTVVIPCYNEAPSLSYLANTLGAVEAGLSARYDLRFVFVDDGSVDDTVPRLRALFGGRPGHRVIEHGANRGVAAAILTGVRAAQTEIVCSIDADCTYDPLELGGMIPRLTEGVAMVTASPYHPDGEVLNVPSWRLVLSRGASTLYRTVLRSELHTFTSCFRVYRRSAVVDLELDDEGFLGVAELLARLVQRGDTVVEHPATLDVRVFGQSKMRTARAVAQHVGLLSRLLRGPTDPRPTHRPSGGTPP